jgi:indole-3-glycerol phosphate synthase
MEQLSFLPLVLSLTHERVRRAKEVVPLSELEKRCADMPPPPPLLPAIRRGDGEGIKIIAEVKLASPSLGNLDGERNLEDLVNSYQRGGAAAISVITEPYFFQGDLAFLERARRKVELPLLRKDFVVSDYQVWESRAYGASAVLLIAALLDRKDLQHKVTLCKYLGMEALVEVHDETELDRALKAGADIVGINNRDLRTLRVSLEVTERLAGNIPGEVVKVSESGYHLRAQVKRAERAGIDALLVGEALVRSSDPGGKIAELRGTLGEC